MAIRSIAVINPKGGSGKTTIATCLAAHLCFEGFQPALLDLDPQCSASDWLAQRPADLTAVATARAISKNGVLKKVRLPKGCDALIIDTPAGLAEDNLKLVLKQAQSIIIPLVPSPIDMRAAWRFLQQLVAMKAIVKEKSKVALVANRCKTRTMIFRELTGFMDGYRFPVVARLRETQNYIRAAEAGMGVSELPSWQAWQDWEEWEPLMHWLKSSASTPK